MRSTVRLNSAKLLSVSLILSATSACVHDSTGVELGTVSEYCRIAGPIIYDSTADTAETVKQIEQHNSKWACLCDRDCPTPAE